jgi:hypothetical protein
MVPIFGYSQNIEITPTFGYMFGGSIRGYDAEADLSDNINYGGSIGLQMDAQGWLEFTYIGQSSTATIRRYGIIDDEREIDLHTSYIHVGVSRESQLGDVTPFGSLSLGLTIFNPKESGLSSHTFSSVNFGAGVKALVGESVGIKLQGRLLVPVAFAGGTVWCGTGGCGLGYASYATIVQGDFSLGVFYRLDR